MLRVLRPTFNGLGLSVETHLLEPPGEATPAGIEVQFWKRLREEGKFASPAELRSRGGGQRAEIAGRGFSEAMLATLRQQASVSQASIDNGRLMLVLKDGSEVAPLVSLIVREGGEVQEVRSGQGSLEDVFLTLMEEEHK